MALTYINLSEFLPLVHPHVPNAALPTQTQALRKAVINFCERTRCWRETFTIDLVEQDSALTGEQTFATIHQIDTAEFDGERLTPAQFSMFTKKDLGEEGRPQFITQSGPNTVSVVPFCAGELRVTAFFKPVHGAEYVAVADSSPQNDFNRVPDFLLSRYGETIAAGAVARVLMLPSEDYDPNKAALYAQQYEDGVARFSDENVFGQQRARARVRPSYF